MQNTLFQTALIAALLSTTFFSVSAAAWGTTPGAECAKKCKKDDMKCYRRCNELK